MKFNHRSTRSLAVAGLVVWLSAGCDGVVQHNLLNGLFTAVSGTASDLLEGFFADQFGFEPGGEAEAEEAHDHEDEHGEEGNDLHIHV